MKKVLVVEDSRTVAHMLSAKIQKSLGFHCQVACSMSEAKGILESESSSFFVALLDLHLPDSYNGEIVDLVRGFGIPCIIFTGASDEKTRELILSKQVVDYIYKKNIHEFDYLTRLLDRLQKNPKVKVLVVDDASSSRTYLKQLLETQRLTVLEASSGVEALGHLQSQSGIKLVIVDYLMPEMGGVELISRIRQKYSREQLAIIGVSAVGKRTISAQLLKSGANDFALKPVMPEEFMCRVMQNIEYVEQIHHIRESAYRDYLTHLYNRRYFFEFGEKLVANAYRDHIHLAVALIDIDHFKKINDTYGHEVGDQALVELGGVLARNFRAGDLVARYGGEEFCVVAVNVPLAVVGDLFEKIRLRVRELRIPTRQGEIGLSVSIGVATRPANSLQKMVNAADELMYAAKMAGRDQVVTDLGENQVVPFSS